MPDPEETTDAVVETPDTEPEVEEQPDEPQEDDLGALKRAYERVKAERKTEKELWEDEEAVFARVRERFPHWLETEGDDVPGDDDIDDDEEPQDDPRLSFVYQREIKRQIDEDLNGFVRDRELPAKAREWVVARAQQDPKGFNPAALKRAVDDWFSLTEDFQPKKPKPKSHQPLKSGGPATEVPDLSDRAARRAYMAEEYRKRTAQT